MTRLLPALSLSTLLALVLLACDKDASVEPQDDTQTDSVADTAPTDDTGPVDDTGEVLAERELLVTALVDGRVKVPGLTVWPQGGVDPDLPLTPETLMEVADAMHPEINDCVNEWAPVLPPELQGRLVLAFTLDEQGVDEAWVDEVEALPAGVLGCFSSAVYNQRWPAAEGGVEVTLPFEVDMGDGGVPQEEGGALKDRREE
ncbi:MAG: hypothetical protein VX899_22995 [Myxococcota bacterium]|nr:hypothetical protein [Myxococcota bacterium]